MSDTHLAEKALSKNIINTAAKFMQRGVDPVIATTTANLVTSNQALIDKINVLKRIDILDKSTKAYLYTIQLTDNALKVEPKVNAIWQLVKTAGIIDDSAVDDEAPIPDTIDSDDDEIQVATNVLNKLLNT